MRFSSCRILTAAALCAALVSCRQQETGTRDTIPFVKEMMVNRAAPGRVALDRSAGRVSADIFIVGPEYQADPLAASLLTADSFDNVTGKNAVDGLLDFSGERICVAYPPAATPDTLRSRERTVRTVLAVLDSVCYKSPYDREGKGYKSFGKIVVMTSPYAMAYGKFDIDTLFAWVGYPNPVVCPLDLMIGRAMESGCKHFGIVSAENASPYEEIFSHIQGADCFVAPLGADNDMAAFLDAYIATGDVEPLDAIIIDDYVSSAYAVSESIARLTDVMSETSLKYSAVLSHKSMVIDPWHLVQEYCVNCLRSRNSFTHRISRPASGKYFLLESEDGSLKTIEYNEIYVQD